MNNYSYSDILKMQNEAKQRVLDMQKRSQSAAGNFFGPQEEKTPEKPKNSFIPVPDTPKAISYPIDFSHPELKSKDEKAENIRRKENFDFPSALSGVFGNISEDDAEKLLIMSLCLLLNREKADGALILALMYLLT